MYLASLSKKIAFSKFKLKIVSSNFNLKAVVSKFNLKIIFSKSTRIVKYLWKMAFLGKKWKCLCNHLYYITLIIYKVLSQLKLFVVLSSTYILSFKSLCLQKYTLCIKYTKPNINYKFILFILT